MAIDNRFKNKPAAPDPKTELLSALRPLQRILWVRNFTNKIQQPQTKIPTAHAERFIISFLLCLCLFIKNHSSLMRHGNQLKNYTNKYAMQLPLTDAALVKIKVFKLIEKLRL